MKNVVIVGAGPAGITAAYELLKKSKDYNVMILEESNEIGGISRTVKYNGNRMDIEDIDSFLRIKKLHSFGNKLCQLKEKLHLMI